MPPLPPPSFLIFSFRQKNGRNKAAVQCTFFFPFYLNTSINQQLHSVTTIVMLGEGKKGKCFLRNKKKQKKKKDDPLPLKFDQKKKDNGRAGREQEPQAQQSSNEGRRAGRSGGEAAAGPRSQGQYCS